MEKISANANVRGDLTKGAVGRGQSLMAGLLRCRRCGNRLRPQYPSSGVRYVCLSHGLLKVMPDLPFGFLALVDLSCRSLRNKDIFGLPKQCRWARLLRCSLPRFELLMKLTSLTARL